MSSEDSELLGIESLNLKTRKQLTRWKCISLVLAIVSLILLIVAARQRNDTSTVTQEEFNTPTTFNPNALTFPNTFPGISVETSAGATTGTHLIAPYTFSYPGNYMAAVSTNGDIVQYLGDAKSPYQAIMWKPEPDVVSNGYSFSEVDEIDQFNDTLLADSSIYLTDALFNEIRRVKCVSPLETTDNHDFDFFDDGTVLLLGLDARTTDLSSEGGPEQAGVIMSHIQILDTDNNLVSYMNGWNYFTPAMSLNPILEDSVRWELAKATSIFRNRDPDLPLKYIISAWSYLNQILFIDMDPNGDGTADPQILFSIGGIDTAATSGITPYTVYNTFTGDSLNGFFGPHDAQITEGTTGDDQFELLVYDNGVIESDYRHDARIVKYRVTLDNSVTPATITNIELIYQFQDVVSAPFGGGVQQLANGNYVMTRLVKPQVIEISPSGTLNTYPSNVVWSMNITDNKMPQEEVNMFVTRAYLVPPTTYPKAT